MIRSSVDLPVPLRPMSPTRSPGCRASRAPSSNGRSPSARWASRRVISGTGADMQRRRAPGSAKLTVLAAAAVVAAELPRFAVGSILTRDAQAHARDRLAPRLGNLRAEVRAMGEARALRQPALRAQNAV